MRTIGVICEYNPFHRGHAWQLAELRRRFGADAAIVCAMSGNCVQRGELALVRKHVRAEAAVRGGADLVLEIPVPWAIASAEGFARGGVQVLAATGVVDTLAFGSECADTARLTRTAEALLAPEFPTLLHEELDKGDSFAAARMRATERLLGWAAPELAAPNDILGTEYCKALRAADSAIVPLALPRSGAAHDGEGSAAHIRARLLAGEAADGQMTPEMARLYAAERAAGRAPVTLRTLERAALYRLRTMEEDALAAYDAGGEGLYRRVWTAGREAGSLEELFAAAKTRRYAHARIRRMLLAVLLGLPAAEAPEKVPYLRVLAMNDRGKALLHAMRKTAALPVVVKPAAVRALEAEAQRVFALEARATDLHALAYPVLAQGRAGSEWTTNPVIVTEEAEEKERR